MAYFNSEMPQTEEELREYFSRTEADRVDPTRLDGFCMFCEKARDYLGQRSRTVESKLVSSLSASISARINTIEIRYKLGILDLDTYVSLMPVEKSEKNIEEAAQDYVKILIDRLDS